MTAHGQSQPQNRGLSLLLCWLMYQTTIACCLTLKAGRAGGNATNPQRIRAWEWESACLALTPLPVLVWQLGKAKGDATGSQDLCSWVI